MTSRWATARKTTSRSLENALITGISLSGSSENPVESVSFAFTKVKVSYNPEADGKLEGFIDKGFDVLKLKPW